MLRLRHLVVAIASRGWWSLRSATRSPDWADRARGSFARFEPCLYLVFAGCCVLWVARKFVGSMRSQVGMLLSSLAGDPIGDRMRELGAWSAPLDDVFIHFDIARATARGHPFEWSEGNGYTSGGTSLLYPLVLALGHAIGFRDLWLGLWASVVACVCTLGLLLAARRLFASLPRATSYLAPPLLLVVGALDWSLLSGMEVALYLGLWGGAFVAYDDLSRLARERPGSVTQTALRLGIWNALLVLTRPEAVTSVAVLSVAAGVATLRGTSWRRAFATLGTAALPGALVLGGQALANWWLTGDLAAAGAVAKLELYDPFLGPREVYEAWKLHVVYQVRRLTEYHLADQPIWGWLWWVLAVVPLVPRATRRHALVLWSSAAFWILVTGLNGQVRWQNERYAMPALAWLLLLVALGSGVLLSQPAFTTGPRRLVRCAGAAFTIPLLGLLAIHQWPRFREQVWFFGRASRNILEQQLRTGLVLRNQLRPAPVRVLVGDAGAIAYAADLPALDLIGLGGFRGLPFARAKRVGIPAAIELLEHVPPAERPDVLAIYPSWWDALPLWFGARISEVPVRGNVICAGQSKVIYRADWSPLLGSSQPVGVAPGEQVRDSVDFADLLSEGAHRLRLGAPRRAHVEMKLLPHPEPIERPETEASAQVAELELRTEGSRLLGPSSPRPETRQAEPGLWDAGRVLAPQDWMNLELHGLERGRSTRLMFRVAPSQTARLLVLMGTQVIGELRLEAADRWQHPSLLVPSKLVQDKLELRLEVAGNTALVIYHLWVLQATAHPDVRGR